MTVRSRFNLPDNYRNGRSLSSNLAVTLMVRPDRAAGAGIQRSRSDRRTAVLRISSFHKSATKGLLTAKAGASPSQW